MTIPGIKALRKIQLGQEVTAGSPVAATTIWRGMGTLQNSIEPVFVEEDIGLLVPSERSYIPFVGAEIEFDEIEATFEQLPYILAASIEGIVSGTPDGIGSGYVYDYLPAISTAKTIKTFTIEGGDNQQAEEMEFGFVTEWKLSGKAKEALMMSSTWQGRQITKTSFTPALSIPSIEHILFSKSKLYIDDDGGTIGTTLKSNTLLEMSLTWKANWIPVWTADGALYFTFIKPTLPEIELEMTFEHDAVGVGEKDAWISQATRLVQLKTEGSNLLTPGTYSKKTLILNLAGRWSTFDKLDEQDGNDILKGTLRASYNPGWANLGEIIVVNELTVLP